MSKTNIQNTNLPNAAILLEFASVQRAARRPDIPPRQPEKPFARADRFSGCLVFQAACTYQHWNNPCLPQTIYAIF